MQLAIGSHFVPVGGKHDFVLIGAHYLGYGDLPFIQIPRFIRQIPAFKIDIAAASVVQFNPVGSLVVIVDQRVIVVRHELADRHRAGQNSA